MENRCGSIEIVISLIIFGLLLSGIWFWRYMLPLSSPHDQLPPVEFDLNTNSPSCPTEDNELRITGIVTNNTGDTCLDKRSCSLVVKTDEKDTEVIYWTDLASCEYQNFANVGSLEENSTIEACGKVINDNTISLCGGSKNYYIRELITKEECEARGNTWTPHPAGGHFCLVR